MTRFLAVMGLITVAMLADAEERHVAMQCDPNGQDFTCVAINIDGIKGAPRWNLYTTPEYQTDGVAITAKAPTHWTLLRFTISDKNNNVRLSVLVRQHHGKVEFAASDSPEQKVEK